ncbi:MAG: hypothetical protein A4E53_04279 [Pelotomaculum sp. PtaB.Bin104]|nr:MAG: hypothetical protein A4E53_04279 [Pelotomaculum sp. PtaB.Bin104]
MTDNENRIIDKLKEIITKADRMTMTNSPREILGHIYGELEFLIVQIENNTLQHKD